MGGLSKSKHWKLTGTIERIQNRKRVNLRRSHTGERSGMWEVHIFWDIASKAVSTTLQKEPKLQKPADVISPRPVLFFGKAHKNLYHSTLGYQHFKLFHWHWCFKHNASTSVLLTHRWYLVTVQVLLLKVLALH